MTVWWVFPILFASWLTWAEAPAIVVRPHTHLAQAKPVLFQDIAEFFSVDAKAAGELNQVKLADGPKEGERLEFNGGAISALLRSQKAWRKMAVKPAVTIPSKVTVENIGDRATEPQVRMELISQWQDQCSCRAQIDTLMMPALGEWAPGTKWRLRLHGDRARGNFNVPLEIIPAAGPVKTLWVRGQVSYYRKAPVARRQLQFGERVQPGDVQYAERDITFARDSIPGENEVIGRKVRQAVAANEILFNGLLENDKALKRGDQVRMAVGRPGWEVVMVGVAEQDGFVGDLVKVRNQKSNQIVQATVVGRGEVSVE
jgi:flagellar basal body P-ring formation protein FlgA